MILLSETVFFSNVAPSTQNSAVGFPQQLSLFLAGGFASHFGALAQVTYTHSSDNICHGQQRFSLCEPDDAWR